MSPAHDFAEPVRQVIEALAALMEQTSQKERAAALGHKAHSEVSRIEQRVATGDADDYLSAYGPARLILFMLAFPEFREAVIAATAPSTAAAQPERCGTDLVDVASTCARSIETIVQRLPDGLSISELQEIDQQLHTLQDSLHRTRLDIGRKLRGPRVAS